MLPLKFCEVLSLKIEPISDDYLIANKLISFIISFKKMS